MTFLWDILPNVFGGTSLWVHVKPYSKSKNGRYASSLLNNFHIGPQYVTHMATQTKLKMCSFSYDGYRIGFSFQNFVSLQKVQRIIAEGLVEYE